MSKRLNRVLDGAVNLNPFAIKLTFASIFLLVDCVSDKQKNNSLTWTSELLERDGELQVIKTMMYGSRKSCSNHYRIAKQKTQVLGNACFMQD